MKVRQTTDLLVKYKILFILLIFLSQQSFSLEPKQASQTFIGKYIRSEMGDYFHLIFVDEAGKEWDFGNANKNNYSGYVLYFEGDKYKEKQFKPNPQYIGEKFKITWALVKSTFPCCGGDMGLVEEEVPTIISLELLK